MTIPHREPQKLLLQGGLEGGAPLRPASRSSGGSPLCGFGPTRSRLSAGRWRSCAAVLFGLGYARVAGVVMLLGGLFDALDGAVARESNRMSSFGAFLDSTLDRLSESAVFVGLIFFYAGADRPYEALLAGVAMTFSLLTSYTRARAEGLNIDCEVGLLERAGRIVILSVFSIVGLPTVGLASSPRAPSSPQPSAYSTSAVRPAARESARRRGRRLQEKTAYEISRLSKRMKAGRASRPARRPHLRGRARGRAARRPPRPRSPDAQPAAPSDSRKPT